MNPIPFPSRCSTAAQSVTGPTTGHARRTADPTYPPVPGSSGRFQTAHRGCRSSRPSPPAVRCLELDGQCHEVTVPAGAGAPVRVFSARNGSVVSNRFRDSLLLITNGGVARSWRSGFRCQRGGGGMVAILGHPRSVHTVADKSTRRVCGNERGENVPTERGSSVLCDYIELHGEALVSYLHVAAKVRSDGLVTADEDHLLYVHEVYLMQTYRPLPGRAAQNDDALRVIGAVAGSGRMTKHAFAVAKEAAADVREAA